MNMGLKYPLLLAFIFLGCHSQLKALASVSFTQTFFQMTQDQILDQLEFQSLVKLGQTQKLSRSEKHMAQQIISYLQPIKQTRAIQFTLSKQYGNKKLRFVFYPHYSEKQLIPGKNRLEVLSNISQADALNTTQEDDNRCSSASLLNAYYFLNGHLKPVFTQFGLGLEMTYEHLHLAQEALYRYANTDGEPGLVAGLYFDHHRDSGEILQIVPDGEFVKAVKFLELRLHPLLGPTKDSRYQRQAAVKQFWRAHPRGVLMITVILNEKNGKISPPRKNGSQVNHMVMVVKEGSRVYMINTGSGENGMGSALKSLGPNEIKQFVYETRGHVFGLTK